MKDRRAIILLIVTASCALVEPQRESYVEVVSLPPDLDEKRRFLRGDFVIAARPRLPQPQKILVQQRPLRQPQVRGQRALGRRA